MLNNHPFSVAGRSNYHLMPASLTMLFTTSANPGCECSRVGSERLLLGTSVEPHVSLRERERQSNPMNGQLFMRREQKKKAGGGNALPQWTSVILTSLLLYCDVLHEETATGPQTVLYSLYMHSSTAQSLKVTTLMCYFTAPYSCQHT